MVASAAPALADSGKPHPTPHAEQVTPPLGYVEGTHKPQTSDGKPNPVAPSVPLPLRWVGDFSQRARWTVAPGVHEVVYDEYSARGPVRLSLLSVKFRHRGVSIDTMNNGPVRDVGTVYQMTTHAHGVAGVNGDFYDIGDTGAPLGVDLNTRRGLLNGRLDGWNSAFYLDHDGRPEIGRLYVHTVIKQHPRLRVTNLNSPSVKPGGIGLYNSQWGVASRRVTDGITRGVRTVVVHHHRVVANRIGLPGAKTIHGQLLIGRGAGASALARLKRGEPLTFGSGLSSRAQLDGRPRMAITGNQMLIDNGLVRVTDDREMAPRTAIGIDRDTHELLLLVVDGRQSFSRGYTMVEMANEMQNLGADEALNLDGGGSSTMIARRAGRLRVVNSPSDGFMRRVANGLVVRYTKPAKK